MCSSKVIMFGGSCWIEQLQDLVTEILIVSLRISCIYLLVGAKGSLVLLCRRMRVKPVLSRWSGI